MRKLTQLCLALGIILAALCPSSVVRAEQLTTGSGNPSEMEAFFDDYLTAQMAANHVAGAEVSVVKDGQVLFTKGYGYADVAKKIPVDPDKTIFILGSLSKLFTWTAVMQLVEQGKLDLDADINTYLDFKIPDTYPQPITLNHLMAHNAGFEDSRFGQMKAASEPVTPLGEWLKTHIPTRVHPPGQFSAYANYGAALAGYIVERVSGMSYDEYVEKNILSPLEMAHTTSRQPTPAALEAKLSQAYLFANQAYQPQPGFNVILNTAPAGSFRSSAGDMARFMLAHLNDGYYEGGRILQPATAQLMHTRSFSHDPRINGMAHGFWEMDMNGEQIIGHAGSHFIYSSYMMLLPEHNMGVFITINSQGGMAFLGGQNYIVFEKAFIDHFFPQTLPPVTPPADFSQRAGQFSGSYAMTMGRSETSPDKLLAMVMAIEVQADSQGLVVPMLGNARFIEVEPLVFRQADEDTLLIFKEDDSHHITQAFLGSNAQTALIKNNWFESPKFNLTLSGLCMFLFLSYLISIPITIFVRRKSTNTPSRQNLARAASWSAGLVSLLSLLVLFGAFASVLNSYGVYTANLPLWAFVPTLSIIVTLLTVGMVVFTIFAWVYHFWGFAGRIHYTLVTLGAVGFVWFMYFWNILGKSF